MDLNAFNASKYLAKTDIPAHGLTLTIAGFGIAEMQDGSKKPSVSWVEVGMKPMLLNKINRQILATAFGTTDTEKMLGRRIQVFNDPTVSMQGQMVGGLRLRPVPVPPAVAQTAQAAAGPNDDIPF